MLTTIDGAGRVVVPKSLRSAMGLTAGQEIDIVFSDGRLEIAIPPTPMQVQLSEAGLPVLVPEAALPALDATDVRAVVESVRA